MRTTQLRETLIAGLPVSPGPAGSRLRAKFYQVLEALNISPVSISLAVADFSFLYRYLEEGSDIRLKITIEASAARVILTGTTPNKAAAQTVKARLVHFHIEDSPQIPNGETFIIASHKYRLKQAPNIQLAERRLKQQTSVEKELTARATEARLSTTQDRLSTVESDLQTAADIQRHMLLSREQLSKIDPQLDCHAYIVPCKEVGGDFFDIICLGQDSFAVVVGDVSGKGVPAAMMMATCSTLIRAYCETDHSPSSIAHKTNNRLLQGNNEECMFTTLLIAVIDCQANKLTYCNAGHNPGLVIHNDSTPEALAAVHGPALGIFANHAYEENATSFHPGDRLVLYTDGATESFNNNNDLYGFERLHKYCINCSSSLGSHRFLSGLLLDISQFSGSEPAHDDVTLVAVRRQAKPRSRGTSQHSLKAKASDRGLTQLKQQVEAIGLDLGLAAKTLASLLMILDELVGNTIHHGKTEKEGSISITLDFEYEQGCLSILLKDNAPPFNPFLAAEPSLNLEIEDRQIGGLGLFLVRSLTNNFSYHYDEPWNCISLQLNDCGDTN